MSKYNSLKHVYISENEEQAIIKILKLLIFCFRVGTAHIDCGVEHRGSFTAQVLLTPQFSSSVALSEHV